MGPCLSLTVVLGALVAFFMVCFSIVRINDPAHRHPRGLVHSPSADVPAPPNKCGVQDSTATILQEWYFLDRDIHVVHGDAMVRNNEYTFDSPMFQRWLSTEVGAATVGIDCQVQQQQCDWCSLGVFTRLPYNDTTKEQFDRLEPDGNGRRYPFSWRSCKAKLHNGTCR